MSRIRYWRLVLPCLVAALLSVWESSPAQAESASRQFGSNASVRLSPADTKSFRASLRRIAEQAGVGFVVEGQPLQDELAPDKARLLPQGGSSTSSGSSVASLPDLVTRVADAFDYHAERSGNIFLLRKRYSDPEDMPEVTFEECRLALREALRVDAALNPRLPLSIHQSPLDGIFEALTAQQLMQIKEGVPLSQLSAAQQAEVWRYALYMYVQSNMRGLQTLSEQMEAVRDKQTALRFQEQKGVRLFGYEMFSPVARQMHFVPLSYPGLERTQPPPAAAPPRGGMNAPSDASAAAFEEVKTLQEWTALLAARQPSGGLPLSVDEELAAKKVMLIGCEKEPPLKVLQAIADIYSLRLRTEYASTKEQAKPTGYRLVRYHGRVAQNVTDLSKEFQRVFPAPLLRALQTEQKKKEAAFARRDFEAKLALAGSPGMRLKIAAARRLRNLMEPRIKAAKEGRVLFEDLGEEERKLLAIILMSEGFRSARVISAESPPPYISNFHELYLQGEPTVKGESGAVESGPPRSFSIMLCRKGVDGRLYVVGGGGAPIRPQSTLAKNLGLQE